MRQGLRFGLPLMGSILLLSGCGTCANTCYFTRDEGGMRVYGGVQADWDGVKQIVNAGPTDSVPGPLWLYLVDMPFSAVGDTVTLPVTIPVSLWWKLNPQRPYLRDVKAPSPKKDSSPASSAAP